MTLMVLVKLSKSQKKTKRCEWGEGAYQEGSRNPELQGCLVREGCISYSSGAVTKCHNQSSLRREGLPHTCGAHSIMESEKWELEAAGHIATLDKKKRAMGVCAQLPFSFFA